MSDTNTHVPKYWETAVRSYGFLSKSPSKLAECPSARETNRQLIDGGHSTEQNPVALLWDASPKYQCWRFFGIRRGSAELIRFKVPKECDPTTKTLIHGLNMRDHPDFRIPTFADFCELHERHETDGDVKKHLNKVRSDRAHYKKKRQEYIRDEMVAEAEDAVIEMQSQPSGERIIAPVKAKITAGPTPPKGKKTTRKRSPIKRSKNA